MDCKPVTELQPMKDVPMDGTRIIMFFISGNALRLFYHEGFGAWYFGDGMRCNTIQGAVGWILSPEFEEYC
jgi:hypothetical protein